MSKKVCKIGEGEREPAVRTLARKGVKQDHQHGNDHKQQEEERIGNAELFSGKVHLHHFTSCLRRK